MTNVPTTLAELFLEGCARHDRPDRFLRKEKDGWKPVSTADFRTRALVCAGALERTGIGRGDRVALLTYNRLEWAVVDYACHLLGAVPVPIFDTLGADSVEHILRDCGAKLLFLENRRQARKTAPFLEGLPDLKETVSFDPVEGTTSFETFCQGEAKERTADVGPDDLATLIYTSGTTGTPKGVMLTHRNLVSNVTAVASLFNVTPADTALSFLPISHVFERMADYLFFHAGATIAFCDNVGRVTKTVQQVRPTVMAAVPRFFELFCQKVRAGLAEQKGLKGWLAGRALKAGAAAAAYRREGKALPPWTAWRFALAKRILLDRIHGQMGGRIRLFASGGAALPHEVSRMLWALGFTVLEGYGLSETAPVIAINRPGRVRMESVGEVLPGTEVRIAEDGEILCRGPGVMKGYFGLPEATAEVIRDGWFSTGDIGVLEERHAAFVQFLLIHGVTSSRTGTSSATSRKSSVASLR